MAVESSSEGYALTQGAGLSVFARALVIVALTLTAYAPLWNAGFIWDDDHYITINATLDAPDGLKQIWLNPRASPQYYPLVFTTFWAERRLWAQAPAGYHAVNVLLHAASALLFWRVLRRLEVPGAWLAAALFALHPVQVESVAWIAERKNVLSGFFYWSAFLAYLRFWPPQKCRPAAGQRWFYAVALALYVAALGSKTVTCSLPAVLAVVAWWKRGRVGGRDAIALAPFFALGIVLGLNTAWLEKAQVGASGPEWSLTALERCLIASRALWFYAAKLAWPTPLMFIYPRLVPDAAAWSQYLYGLAAIAVLAALWSARRYFGRGPLAAVVCFVGTLVPALGFINVYPMRYTFVADHYQYLAAAALLALAAAAATQGAQRIGLAGQRALALVAAGVLVTLAGLTWQRAHVFFQARVLWLDTVAKNPDCWMAQNHLGVLDLQEGRPDRAQARFEKTLALRPEHGGAHCNLASALDRLGHPQEAAREYEQALALDPKSADGHSDYGGLLARQGRWAEAEAHCAQAVRCDPAHWHARYNLGLTLAQRHAWAEAAAEFASAAKLNPKWAPTWHELGNAQLRLARPEAAATAFRQAVDLEPTSAALRYCLAVAYFKARREKEAAAAEVDAAHLDSAGRAARDTAWSLATDPDPVIRDGPVAVRLAERACTAVREPPPDWLDALAAAYAESGRFDRAAEAARRAVALAGGAPARPDLQARLALYEERRAFRAGSESTP